MCLPLFIPPSKTYDAKFEPLGVPPRKIHVALYEPKGTPPFVPPYKTVCCNL